MVTLEIKPHEQEVLRTKLFKLTHSIIKELFYNYGYSIKPQDQLHLVKYIAKILNPVLNVIDDDNEDVDKVVHLANSKTCKYLLNDTEYCESMFNRGTIYVESIVRNLNEYYPLQTEFDDDKYFTILADVLRKLFKLVDNFCRNENYTFKFIDIYDEDYLYIKHVVTHEDVTIVLVDNNMFGELVCDKSEVETMEIILDKYKAVIELALAMIQKRKQEEINSFFNI